MADQTFRDIELKLLAATNYGLDIIQELYPQVDLRKNFKIRDDEKTASASVKLKEQKGVQAYRLTDYGGTIKNENAFGLYGLQKGISYAEAVLELARNYDEKGHNILEKQNVYPQPEYRECRPEEFTGTLNDKGFCYTTKEFTRFELGLLGPEIAGGEELDEFGNHRSPLVTPEDCAKVNLVSLAEYSHLTADKTKVCTWRSTEKFPILAFINQDEKIGEWLKIYQPRNGKKQREDGKDRRFMHLGGRPAGFIFGFDRLNILLSEHRDSKLEEFETLYKENADNELEKLKLPFIVVATGGSDGLNLLALGVPTVWFNSETETINKNILSKLQKYAEEIINVPDCDFTGIREGKKLALEFMDVRTLWLDKYFRSENQKDFKDFCRQNQSMRREQLTRRVNDMLAAAMPAKFWSSFYNEKTKKYAHNFSSVFSFYFLGLNGFCRVVDKSRKDGYYFAHVVGNVVEEVDVPTMRNFIKDFLVEKQRQEGVREISHSLIDAFVGTPKFGDNVMSLLQSRELDFTDFEQDAQYFFFGKDVLKVTRNGVAVSSFDRYVLKSQLLDELVADQALHRMKAQNFKIMEPMFEIKSTGLNTYDIEIKDGSCDFFNYLVQTSRVHWEHDRKGYVADGKSEEDFYQASRFKITGKYLDAQQNQEQINHLVNKMWTHGYNAHRYKDPSKPWGPWAVDEAVLEDDVAEGGAGKTLFYHALKYLCNFFEIPKSEDTDDKFKFEGITEHTDFVYYDDVDRGFDMRTLFSEMTGGMSVNTKNVSRVKIPYSLSPKMGFSSNYSIRHHDGSYVRRRIVVGFSDYYHAENPDADRQAVEPKDDFGHRLFDDWDDEQWFKFFNFSFQCLAFYLGTREKISAPSSNIMLRTYYTEMGEYFPKWADNYFPPLEGQEMIKKKVEEDMEVYAQENKIKWLQGVKANTFKKKLKAWCKINGYELDDKIKKNIEQVDANGNTIMGPDKKPYKKTTDHIKIIKKDEYKTEDGELSSDQYF